MKYKNEDINAVKHNLYKFASKIDDDQISQTDYEVGLLKTAKAFSGIVLIAKNNKRKEGHDEAK